MAWTVVGGFAFSNPRDQSIYPTLQWLFDQGVSITTRNSVGDTIFSAIPERENPELVGWLLEHGARFASSINAARASRQIAAAYPDPRQKMMRLIAMSNVHPQQYIEQELERILKQFYPGDLTQEDRVLLEKSFMLAIAQGNEIYSAILNEFLNHLSAKTLQEGLIRAAEVGNNAAVVAILDAVTSKKESNRENWQTTLVKALEAAIRRGNTDCIISLFDALPVQERYGIIKGLSKALESLPNMGAREREALLKRLDDETSLQQESLLPFSLRRLISGLSSNAIPTLLALLLGSWQHSSRTHH